MPLQHPRLCTISTRLARNGSKRPLSSPIFRLSNMAVCCTVQVHGTCALALRIGIGDLWGFWLGPHGVMVRGCASNDTNALPFPILDLAGTFCRTQTSLHHSHQSVRRPMKAKVGGLGRANSHRELHTCKLVSSVPRQERATPRAMCCVRLCRLSRLLRASLVCQVPHLIVYQVIGEYVLRSTLERFCLLVRSMPIVTAILQIQQTRESIPVD